MCIRDSFITGKESFQLFLFQLAVGFVRLLGVPDNSLQKVVQMCIRDRLRSASVTAPLLSTVPL